ncbi:TRAP transporter small permease subunit [Cellvibrio sp. OA-2007]|uniref:TRAP transporter small permease subunit n=1 Tax=Cellvibrio sp. OA-2007 TaxID=529823 RepID=UPI000782BA1C|nr:TRAP transporter small permease subunit [Cellvibrio sp. OA-2007]
MNHTSAPASSFFLLRWLDAIAEFTGNTTAWLTGIMVIIACIVVGLRHLLGIGSIALQESVTYMHALVFMLGAAYTLKRGGHVRVDIVYRRMSVRKRAWVDVLGSLLFTLPLMIFIGWGSWEFVQESWRINEGSANSGGMGGVYLLKSLLPLMALSVSLQAIAELLRSLLLLMNIIPESEFVAQEESSC